MGQLTTDKHPKHINPEPWERSKLHDGFAFVPDGGACHHCQFDRKDLDHLCTRHDCSGGIWVTVKDAAIRRMEDT